MYLRICIFLISWTYFKAHWFNSFPLPSNTISTHGDSSVPHVQQYHLHTCPVLFVQQYHLHTWRQFSSPCPAIPSPHMETVQFPMSSNTLSTHGDSSVPHVQQYTLYTWRQFNSPCPAIHSLHMETVQLPMSSNTLSTHGDSSIPHVQQYHLLHMETVLTISTHGDCSIPSPHMETIQRHLHT